MDKALAFLFTEVTQAAAVAAYSWVGRGDKNKADGAAVEAMRKALMALPIQGEIVIGEGEIDEAPMLYIGENVGSGEGVCVEIAVDPIDGTRLTALGENNAIAVLAAGAKGCFLHAPDMYMEKIVAGPMAQGVLALDLGLEENVRALSKALSKPLSELRVCVLDKPRHKEVMALLYGLGVRVQAISDGDILAALRCMLGEVDLVYGIGGAPEGVVAAALVRAFGGVMQARLKWRDEVKGESAENKAYAEEERKRCLAMGIDGAALLELKDLVRHDDFVFVATAITDTGVLKGVREEGGKIFTHSLCVRGQDKWVSFIEGFFCHCQNAFK